MPASYPSAIKTFTTLVDGVDDVLASHQNDPNAEITAIETELGTNPRGTAADVKTRITAIETTLGTNPQGAFGTVAERLDTFSDVAMAQGTVSAGGTIPLPSGYTEGQCAWIVSIADADWSDDQHATSFTIGFALSGRVVVDNHKAGSPKTANYIIIGVK